MWARRTALALLVGLPGCDDETAEGGDAGSDSNVSADSGPCASCASGTYCSRDGRCLECVSEETSCDGEDEDCDRSVDDDCPAIEGRSYRVVLGAVDEPLGGGGAAGTIRELWAKIDGEWVLLTEPCTSASCYGTSLLFPRFDLAHAEPFFVWSRPTIHSPYLAQSPPAYAKWIYSRNVTAEATTVPGTLYHVRFVSSGIHDESGALVHDGSLSIEYWFDETGWSVEYGFTSRSDALVTAVVHVPVPVLRSDLVDRWLADDLEGRYPSDAASVATGPRGGVSLFGPAAAMVTVSPSLRHSMHAGHGALQIVAEDAPAYDVAAGVVAFFADDARPAPRDPLWAEAPGLGRRYGTTYRIDVAPAAATEDEARAAAHAALDARRAVPSATWLDAPYGLVPAALFQHHGTAFLQKGEHQASFGTFEAIHDAHPRFRLEAYMLTSPHYVPCYGGLGLYDFWPVPLSCDPASADCWVDPEAKAAFLRAEDEGWLVLSRTGDGHDGNDLCACPACAGADWYLLDAEAAGELYDAIGEELEAFGSRTHDGLDILPSHWFINTDGLRGLRAKGVISHAGISAPQMIEPAILEAGRVPNYRWHYLDEVDMAYVEEAFAITLGGVFLQPETVDAFVNSSVPLFFYSHDFELDPNGGYLGDYYASVIDRIEELGDQTLWMQPFEVGRFAYGLAHLEIASGPSTDRAVSLAIDNGSSDAVAVEGLTFEVQGGAADLRLARVVTQPPTLVCIQGDRRFWIDVPRGSTLEVTAELAPGAGLAQGVLRARALTDARDVPGARVSVIQEGEVVYDGPAGDILLDQGRYDITIGGRTFEDVLVNGGRTVISHTAER
ncbi:MAG: hypothetical protein HYY06_12175 [Deltaproteobacteria bacterium]|nr:hypothetical protein [Deltaproteobacteria bacterium]